VISYLYTKKESPSVNEEKKEQKLLVMFLEKTLIRHLTRPMKNNKRTGKKIKKKTDIYRFMIDKGLSCYFVYLYYFTQYSFS